MDKTRKLNALASLILLFIVGLACSSTDETQKANKIVDDANQAITDANKISEDGLAKVYSMETMLPKIKTRNDLSIARGVARDSISILAKAKDQYDDAAKKLAEAGKLSINDKFREYLDLKSQEMKTRSSSIETVSREPQALIDSQTVSEFTFKVKSITDNFKNLKQQADDLAKKAAKLQEENRDVIKGSI